MSEITALLVISISIAFNIFLATWMIQKLKYIEYLERSNGSWHELVVDMLNAEDVTDD